jgi:hypothetical protein
MLLAHRSVIYITKLDFLTVFKTAYYKTFTAESIKRAFRGARLILYNLDTIVLRLNIHLYTLN